VATNDPSDRWVLTRFKMGIWLPDVIVTWGDVPIDPRSNKRLRKPSPEFIYEIQRRIGDVELHEMIYLGDDK
jgi:hypothetical protein